MYCRPQQNNTNTGFKNLYIFPHMDLKWKYQKQWPGGISTKRCSENFAKIMEKHEVSFNKVSDLQIATL